MTKRKIQYWVIPPETNAEFVASMEEVLETYAQPYDKRYPVVCMDEQPVQLLKETRVPVSATKRHARRVDYEYERAGTASIFMFCEPLSGWREVHVRQQRTKVDWAREMDDFLRTRYADAEKVILVCDNLNTHTKGRFTTFCARAGTVDCAAFGVSLYAQARQLAQHRRERVELDDTSMSEGTPLRRHETPPNRNPSLASGQQQAATRSRLAIQNRKHTPQAQVDLP